MSFLHSIGLKKSSKFSPGKTTPDQGSRSKSPLMKSTKSSPSPPLLIDDNQSSFQSTTKDGAIIDISTVNTLISDLPATPLTPATIDLSNSPGSPIIKIDSLSGSGDKYMKRSIPPPLNLEPRKSSLGIPSSHSMDNLSSTPSRKSLGMCLEYMSFNGSMVDHILIEWINVCIMDGWIALMNNDH